MKSLTRPVLIRLPTDMVRQVDHLLVDLGIPRTTLIEFAVQNMLDGLSLDQIAASLRDFVEERDREEEA